MRAQTTLDFAIGISLFLVVVVFTLAFMPGMLDPFVASQEENTVAADRAVDQLTQTMLGSPEAPFRLETDCTVAFFGGPSATGCRFDQSETVKERLGLVGSPPGTGVDLQIQVRGNVSESDSDGDDVVCWDADTGQLVEEDESACDPGDGDTVLETGGDPPTQHRGVVVSRRVVSLDGETATVMVRVW